MFLFAFIIDLISIFSDTLIVLVKDGPTPELPSISFLMIGLNRELRSVLSLLKRYLRPLLPSISNRDPLLDTSIVFPLSSSILNY